MINISQTKITFLADIHRSFHLDKSNKYFYFDLIGWREEQISNFLQLIVKDNELCLVFPFISTTRNPSDAYLRLSDQFLVTNNSNTKLISNYIDNQWNNSQFQISEGTPAHLYFKYKKVYLQHTMY